MSDPSQKKRKRPSVGNLLSWAVDKAESKLLSMLDKPSADTLLNFEDGRRISTHSVILSLASEPLAGMLEETSTRGEVVKELRLTDDPEGWLEVLAHVYPTMPTMTWASVHSMLPIVHKYDFRELLSACCNWITSRSQRFSSNVDSDNFVLRWLALAECLQIDAIRSRTMSFMASEFAASRFGALQDKALFGALSNETHAEVVALLGRSTRRPAGQRWQCTSCKLEVELSYSVLNGGYSRSRSCSQHPLQPNCGTCHWPMHALSANGGPPPLPYYHPYQAGMVNAGAVGEGDEYETDSEDDDSEDDEGSGEGDRTDGDYASDDGEGGYDSDLD